MTAQDSNRPVWKHIERLVKEEHALYKQGKLSDGDRQRLRTLEVELDQCWDLLRQRRARREFASDPNDARVRPPEIVELRAVAGNGRSWIFRSWRLMTRAVVVRRGPGNRPMRMCEAPSSQSGVCCCAVRKTASGTTTGRRLVRARPSV